MEAIVASGKAKAIIIGNLGKDPEVRFTAAGTPVCTLSVACTERTKGKDGNYEEQTEWISLVAFGRTAENCGQYLAKGKQIYAEGRIRTREWEGKDGVKKSRTEVLADSVMFLGSGTKQDHDAAPPAAAKAAPKKQASSDDDDIPPF